MKSIELLSPARNLECGLAAINHGADAVYIGALQFGARIAAGNSISDIESLVKYAHKFRSKIYVTINTILTDNQLALAQKMIQQLYEVGVDALIVQDMGVMKLDLPPIVLHASTQTDNRTPEKVRFLENVGFSRVVLARELNLQQISEISAQTNVELEAFVHGSLCVSYSGQCYMSQAMSGRSANRGECAQYCRMPYDLIDANGTLIAKNKHLLSLKDLDLSDSLEQLMDAGICSLKIEGRLKDVSYVKNITAYYRKKIDEILCHQSKYKRSSIGKTTFFFEPNPQKSFHRGTTDYFLRCRKSGIIQPETPKSIGEEVGQVTKSVSGFFELQSRTSLNNGDGFCFFNEKSSLEGFQINRVELLSKGIVRCFPFQPVQLSIGTHLFRNQDIQFEKMLKTTSSERKVNIKIELTEVSKGFALKLTDEEGIFIQMEFESQKQLSKNPESVLRNINQQLIKLGDTIYFCSDIFVDVSQPWFIPASVLNDWRRKTVAALDELRDINYRKEIPKERKNSLFPAEKLTYLGNVINQKAFQFYLDNGLTAIDKGFELQQPKNAVLMTTKYCLKYELGYCHLQKKSLSVDEPLFLKNKQGLFQLKFDCRNCEMMVLLS